MQPQPNSSSTLTTKGYDHSRSPTAAAVQHGQSLQRGRGSASAAQLSKLNTVAAHLNLEASSDRARLSFRGTSDSIGARERRPRLSHG